MRFVRLRTILIGGEKGLSIEMDRCSDYAAQLDQCDKEIDDIYHGYALRHNLSDAVLWILYAMCDSKDRVTQADLCSCWFFSRQTINSALKGLQQQGIIKLVSIPGNRKSKSIVFTEHGKAMAEDIIMPLKQAEKQVFDALSDEENKLFAELTQKRCSLLREFLKTE